MANIFSEINRVWEESVASLGLLPTSKIFTGRAPDKYLPEGETTPVKLETPYAIIFEPVSSDVIYRTTEKVSDMFTIQITFTDDDLDKAMALRDAAADVLENPELEGVPKLFLHRTSLGWLQAPDGLFEAFIRFEYQN